MAKSVYLASPFFNDSEISAMNDVKDVLENVHDLDVFAPYEHQNKHLQFGSMEWREATYTGDVAGILGSDIVVAVINGNYMDSGTAWEVGFAVAVGIPVIVVNVGKEVNLMIANSLTAYLDDIEELKKYDFETLPAKPYKEYVW